MIHKAVLFYFFIFQPFLHIFRLSAAVFVVFVLVFVTTVCIVNNKNNDTRCKFLEDNLICIPYPYQAEWFSFVEVSRMTFFTNRLKIIALDNDNQKPLDLHAFEKNILIKTPALQLLLIEHSKITYIPNLESNPKLLHLNVSHNEIERVNAFEFSSTSLDLLDLSFNKISFIDENAFNVRIRNTETGLNLTEIYLNNNRLTRANPAWFRNLDKLNKIDLRNNLIASITSRFFSEFKAMNYVKLHNFILVDDVIERDDERSVQKL